MYFHKSEVLKKFFSRLAKYDVVLTTYNIVGKEVGAPEGDKNGEEPVKDDESEKVTGLLLLLIKWGFRRG